MRIVIGGDHGGFALKHAVFAFLSENGYDVRDLGCFDLQSVDYPDYGFAVGEAVASGQADRGIAICTTGIGICMAANKVAGVRAALCTTILAAEMTRRHNDANVLCLGGNTVSNEQAIAITQTFLGTEFEGGRHAVRVEKINHYKNI
ncbi:MAG: ribose 5-phosphate isomerase B [Clostridiales bacterium]|nr:ribose 5-phosphate isomerase B [Clostridiales bacterium]MCL2884955.1 ribose 5-phosphate isomerase B [Oscillospiraceae bacterium]